MKIVYLLFLTLVTVVSLGFLVPQAHAVDTNAISIQNILVQPSMIKVGDTFTVTATLVNNSTVPIVVETGECSSMDTQVPFFTVVFDNHAKTKSKNLTCAGVDLMQILNPGKKITGTSPDSTLSYIAIEPGTANVTVTFSYHVINQTDPTQPNIEHTISKQFQFLIHDVNETYAQKPPVYFTSPLQQIKAGVSAQNVKCGVNFNLVIKSEDGSPACVKLDAAYMLIKRGWAASESAYPGGDAQFALYTNSTIMPAHLPRSSGLRIPYYEPSRVINYSGFDGVYNETFQFRGTQHDYVLKPGSTGIITFKLEAVSTEQQGQSYPIPLPKSLNLINYAIFYHEITSLEDLSKYPGVTFSDNDHRGGFTACSIGPTSGGSCIGGGSNPIEAFVTDHPGVDVLFEPPSEVLPLGMNATSQVVTMTITADSNASRGTYLVILSSIGVDSFLLTVGDQPYHE